MNKRVTQGLLLFIVLSIITIGIIYRDSFQVEKLILWIDQAGVAAPLVFVLVYAMATVAFVPGAVITLTGGALFGPVLGTLYNLIGATLGASLAFLVSRHIASEWVKKKAKGRTQQLIDGVEAEGWKFVAFVRLVPLFPFNLLNYLLGLTRIPLTQYAIASFVFMFPGALAYTWLGYVGREAAAGSEGLIQKALLALSLLAVVAFIPRIIANWRIRDALTVAQLKESIAKNPDLLILDVRPQADYLGAEQGHIEGSKNIPSDDLEQRIGEIEHWRERPIAIVCRTDRRSKKAAALLARKGFGDVHVVHDGMTAWNQAGWPVIRPEQFGDR